MLADHGLNKVPFAPYWNAAKAADPKTPQRVVLPLDNGFETDNLAVISETDLLGDRLARPRRRRRASNFLAEAAALTPGDLVVHIDHGIGRYAGLKTLEVQGAPHDTLELHYGGEAKLYLPVENIDLLTRYGADGENVQLDRLGGAAWQSRKAKAKERLREMAEGLIKIAAARQLNHSDEVDPPPGLFDEFCARFPYEETEDQLNAIADVLGDLAQGRPMDRLICGDVGFGKTEVALRAAFVMAMSGKQVAVVCPTTLLSRQHFKTFTERFQGWPVKVRQLSRLVSAKDATANREGLARGEVEIVVGTHAILAEQVKFKDLGLVIVDEEQHFGVKHKEKLKALRADVHMLTLTATPIPRTPADGPVGHPRDVDHRHPADRPAGGAHLHHAVRPGGGARGPAAREVPRRPGLLRGPALADLPELERFPEGTGPRGEIRRRPRPDVGHPAGRRDERLLRRAVRRAAVDHHRGERARHPHRQHPGHPPRRHVRPGPALPAARARRPGQDAGLCLSDHAGGEADHAFRRENA